MKIFSRILCLLGSILALSLCVTPAWAASGTTADLDLTKTGSITLTLKDADGNALTGGWLDCIRVADIVETDSGITYALTNGFENKGVSLSGFLAGTESAAALAEKLNKVVPSTAKKLARRPDKDGKVFFEERTLGMYLIRQRVQSGYYKAITPFLCTVPVNSDNGWIYDVTATPKVGTVVPKQTPKKGKKLPQTGQLNWPVPVLAVSGLAVFSAGWLLTKDKNEKDHR